MTSQRILVTGHRGYIGSVMAPYLLSRGHDVVGVDVGYFNECTLVPQETEVPELRRDIRDLTSDDLRGFDAVVHLAALSNDPIGNLNPEWTRQINGEGSVTLARLAREAGVGRFLFSSSCIMYGLSKADVATEESPLAPQTEYARSKVYSEERIRELASPDFSPVYLRNGTVYGLSPRMRFDTVFNDLIGSAITQGHIAVYSDGKPWRPVVHVDDVARAFEAVLEAPAELIHDQAFNTGAESLNRQVIDLARIASDAVPGSTLEVLARPGADQRTYRADFTKFANTFPQFEFTWTPERGAARLAQEYRQIGLDTETFRDPRFTRLAWLNRLLDSEAFTDDLRLREVA